jgi:hypothetical protein
VFFSMSGSKLPGYIVPVFPALAILVAVALDQINDRSWNRQINALLVLAVAGLIAAPFVATLGNETNPNEVFRASPSILAWRLPYFGRHAAGAPPAARRGLLPSIAAFSLALFLTCTIGLMGHEVMGRRASGVDLVPAIKAVLKDDMPLYGVGVLDHTLPFYLGHTLTMVAAPDELEFGTHAGAGQVDSHHGRLPRQMADGQPALGIMSPETYDVWRPATCRCTWWPATCAAWSSAISRRRPRRPAGLQNRAMTLSTFAFIFTGVLLNACAQLLLKAGVNAVGAITIDRATLFSTALRVLTQWPVIGGLTLYVVSVAYGSSACRAWTCRLPIRCCRSAMWSTRWPPGGCSAR